MKIYELCDLRDRLEQYTRKNSLEIHGVPERAYESPEEVVIKIAEALEVPVHPNLTMKLPTNLIGRATSRLSLIS